MLGGYHGAINHTRQDTVTATGFYQVSGISSASVITDDGILWVTPMFRVKIGVDAASYAVKVNEAQGWSIFPEFYKNYGTLNALADGLGGMCAFNIFKGLEQQNPTQVSFIVTEENPSSITLCLNRVFYNSASNTAIINISRADVEMSARTIISDNDIHISYTNIDSANIRITCTTVNGNAFGNLAVTVLQKWGTASMTPEN